MQRTTSTLQICHPRGQYVQLLRVTYEFNIANMPLAMQVVLIDTCNVQVLRLKYVFHPTKQQVELLPATYQFSVANMCLAMQVGRIARFTVKVLCCKYAFIYIGRQNSYVLHTSSMLHIMHIQLFRQVDYLYMLLSVIAIPINYKTNFGAEEIYKHKGEINQFKMF